MKQLSWKPRRRGATYCSPACGADCTHADFLFAHKEGKALAKRCGKQFTHHVWENMGWHWKAVALGGKLNVYEFDSSDFWADLHVDSAQYHAHGRTPKAAIEKVIGRIKQHGLAIEKVLHALK